MDIWFQSMPSSPTVSMASTPVTTLPVSVPALSDDLSEPPQAASAASMHSVIKTAMIFFMEWYLLSWCLGSGARSAQSSVPALCLVLAYLMSRPVSLLYTFMRPG